MNFPVGYKDIEKFEENNPNIVLKIYGVKGVSTHTTKKELHQKMFPFYFPILTPEEIKAKKVLYLLILFPNDEVITSRLKKNNYDIGHIIPIVDINAFLRGWRSDSNEYICDGCGNSFRTEEARDNHINKGCYVRETGQFKLSTKNEFFNSQSCCPRNPFAIYADTETDMKKRIEAMNPDDDWDEFHDPQGIEFNVKTDYSEIFEKFNIPLHYKIKGADCMTKAVEEYLKLFEKKDKNGMSFKKYIKETDYEINPSQKQQREYEEADTCWCGYPFDDEFFENADDKDETVDVTPKRTTKIMTIKTFLERYCLDKSLDEIKKMYEEYKETHITPAGKIKLPPKRSPLYKKINRRKVFDHDHLKEEDNGIGAAHSYCNLQRQNRRFFIPVIFHNGSNYDFHLLVRELIYHTEHNILPIAKSAYNFIKFDWGIFRFIDSRRFLNSSEEKLADQLANRSIDEKTGTYKKDKKMEIS